MALVLALSGCSGAPGGPALGTEDGGTPLENAKKAISTGDYQTAYAALSKALSESPKDPAVHFNMGWVYLHTNELEKAQEELDKLSQLAPGSAHFYHLRGAINGKLDHEYDAIADYKSALAKAPSDFQLYFELAEAYSDLHQEENALDALEQGFTYIPDNDLDTQVNFTLASCTANSHLKRFTEAIEDCQQALDALNIRDEGLKNSGTRPGSEAAMEKQRIRDMIANICLIQSVDEKGQPIQACADHPRAGDGQVNPDLGETPGDTDQDEDPKAGD